MQLREPNKLYVSSEVVRIPDAGHSSRGNSKFASNVDANVTANRQKKSCRRPSPQFLVEHAAVLTASTSH